MWLNPCYDEHNSEAKTYNIVTPQMLTHDQGQMQNRPTRINILQFFENKTTSQLTAHYKMLTLTLSTYL